MIIQKEFVPYQLNTKLNSNVQQYFAEVEFGVLANNRCKNYGICKIELVETFKPGAAEKRGCKCKYGKAIISINIKNQVEMAFAKSGMEAKTIKKYFRQKSFKVDEDYASNLNDYSSEIQSLVKIKKGRYSILETLGFFIVKFY